MIFNESFNSERLKEESFSHLLLAHQAQTNLPSVAVTGPYDPNSTAPYLDELLDKWVLNSLEGEWSQPLLERYQRRGLSKGCWERIPQRDGVREKTEGSQQLGTLSPLLVKIQLASFSCI